MTRPVRYLSVANVKALHNQIMELTGWSSSPLRSEGLLESAVARPQNAAHYEDADLVLQAAMLAIGISQNQPFLDGNKRTAYIAMLTFLEANRFTLNAKPMDIALRLEAVANRTGTLDEATQDFADWLRDSLVALDE